MGSKTTTSSTKSRPVVTPQLQGMYNELVSSALAQNRDPVVANPFARAAGLSDRENTAYTMLDQLMGKYQGSIDQGLAAQQEALARSGRAPTQAELEQYMNPFTETVLNRTIDRIREQGDRNNLDIGSRSALSGAFGGSRQGLLEGLNMADTQRNIGDTYYRGMSDNYNQGLATLLSQIDRMSGNARGLVDLARQGQAYGLTDATAMEAAGKAERGVEQMDLDLKAQDFYNQIMQRQNKLGNLVNVTGALSPGSIGQDSKTTQKTSGDPLSTILGVASLVAAPFTGGASLMGSLGGGLGGLASSGIWGALGGGKKEGGPVKKYAYGGRVGNPFSMGESSDVIRQTQNPFKSDGITSTPGGYSGANQAPVNPVLLSDGPDISNTSGGFVSPAVPYNAGPVAIENINPADRGGNPVAQLLDQYKSGLRTADPGMGASDMMGRVTLAGGGPVNKGYAEGGFLESLFGGSVPTSGGKRKVDQLFGKDNLSDTLLNIGLSLLASGGTPVGEGLAAGIGGSLESGQVDPMGLLNQQYKQMQIQNLVDQMDNRARDDEYRAKKDADDRALREMLGLATVGNAATNTELSALRLDLAREKFEEDKKKGPGFSASNYPGLNEDMKTLDAALYGDEPDIGRAKSVAGRLKNTANLLYEEGHETQAAALLKRIKELEAREAAAEAVAGTVRGLKIK